MTCYKFLSVDNCADISSDVYNYLRDHTDILTNKLNNRYFWNWLDLDDVLIKVPSLDAWLKQKNVEAKVIAVTYLEPTFEPGSMLHADGDYTDLRLLWPISNCIGTQTVFYDIDQKYLTKTSNAYATFYKVDIPPPYHEIGRVELTSPIVFDPGVVHDIVVNQPISGPRITMTIGFAPGKEYSKNLEAW